MAAGESTLTPAELRTIHGLRESFVEWDAIDAQLGRVVRHAYGRARRGGALAAALGEGAATVPVAVAGAGERRESGNGAILAGETGQKAAAPPAWQAIQTPTGTETTIESKASDRIRTLDDLLDACDVDLAVWTVERFVVNKWETAAASNDGAGGMKVQELFQVKAWLKPAHALATATAVIDAMKADMIAHAPTYPQVRFLRPQPSDRHMAIVSITDHHFGLLAWADESGESYDVAIAERLAGEAMTAILSRLQPYPLERIMLSLGSDWFHSDKTVDGKGGSTTRGTVQETDGRWQRTWRAGVRAAVGLIDQASAVAPVTALFRSGNHDEQTAFFLGDLIDAWYRKSSAVQITNVPAPRCYERYGESLIGFAHGHNEKPSSLPMLMATERPTDWAATKFHDWMTGHLHRKGILMDEVGGVQMYTMPSLCGRDAWHAAKGYAHRRSCEARIYHHDEGPIAHLTFNAKAVA